MSLERACVAKCDECHTRSPTYGGRWTGARKVLTKGGWVFVKGKKSLDGQKGSQHEYDYEFAYCSNCAKVMTVKALVAIPPEAAKALLDFQAENGRTWKAKLADLWVSGKEESGLRWIRNAYGNEGVAKLDMAELEKIVRMREAAEEEIKAAVKANPSGWEHGAECPCPVCMVRNRPKDPCVKCANFREGNCGLGINKNPSACKEFDSISEVSK